MISLAPNTSEVLPDRRERASPEGRLVANFNGLKFAPGNLMQLVRRHEPT